MRIRENDMSRGQKMKICSLGNRIVNNYLIPCDEGYILIDTGYENGFRRFQRKLMENGIRPEDIRYVFLTHAHDDHAGFLNDVLAITNAKVILHPLAIEGLKKGQNSFEGGCSSRLAWLFCRILALAGHGDHRYPAVRDEYLDRLVSIDSEQFRTLRFPYGVLRTPGHTADHISLIAGGVKFAPNTASMPSGDLVIILSILSGYLIQCNDEPRNPINDLNRGSKVSHLLDGRFTVEMCL